MECESFSKSLCLFGTSECTHNLADVIHRFKDDKRGLNRWLKEKVYDGANIHYAILYHGTSAKHNIVNGGISREQQSRVKKVYSRSPVLSTSLCFRAVLISLGMSLIPTIMKQWSMRSEYLLKT